MSKHDIDFLTAQTRRLEALGIVLGNGNGEYFVCMPCRVGRHDNCVSKQPLHPHPRCGRKRVYTSGYERLKAHRRRKSRMITK
jgi:hypothetical protein